MHVGYQSNHETHPTNPIHLLLLLLHHHHHRHHHHDYQTHRFPRRAPRRSRSDCWLKRSDCIPQGAACGCHMGVIAPVDPPTERTHLFGSLMSNTDVTVLTRTLMMSTTTGSGTMRPPKRVRICGLGGRILAFCLPWLLALYFYALTSLESNYWRFASFAFARFYRDTNSSVLPTNKYRGRKKITSLDSVIKSIASLLTYVKCDILQNVFKSVGDFYRVNREKRLSFDGALRTKIESSWRESKIRPGKGEEKPKKKGPDA